MPITRSTWIDDDGTGKTGTVINNAELQKIYNNIDAFGNGTPDILTNTDSGTLNNWAPSGLGTRAAVITWSSSVGDASVTGIRAGVPGQLLMIRNYSAKTLFMQQNSAASLAANRLGNIAQSGATPIANSGFGTYFYDGTLGLWVLVAHEQGAWVTPAFSAADYTGITSITAGQITTAKYRLSGRTLHWAVAISAATASGGAIYRTLFGFSASGTQSTPYGYLTGVTPGVGYGQIAGTVIQFFRSLNGDPIPAGAMHLSGSGQAEVT